MFDLQQMFVYLKGRKKKKVLQLQQFSEEGDPCQRYS